jgi:AcrR family transcriptional regulator
VSGSPSRRRDEILQAAAKVFAADGYTSTSMREVAAEAGIQAGSLYHHFASKEAIAVELVEAYHADLVRAVRELAIPGGNPVDALRAFAREVAGVSFRHKAALQLTVFDAPAAASSSLKTIVRGEPPGVGRQWRALISAAVTAGAIDPAVDRRILRHVLHYTILQASLTDGEVMPGPAAVADCVTGILLDGIATAPPDLGERSVATRVVDRARVAWAAEAASRGQERYTLLLDEARTLFAQRGYEATTMRDIAEAAGITASNLYRYFESKDSMITEILGEFSDRLLRTFKEVMQAGAPVVETLDAILWVLAQTGQLFGREIEILQGFGRLVALGVAGQYQKDAEARQAMLTGLIEQGVAAGELRLTATPALTAWCVREIMWTPMASLMPVSPQRVRDFCRRTVLSGAARLA